MCLSRPIAVLTSILWLLTFEVVAPQALLVLLVLTVRIYLWYMFGLEKRCEVPPIPKVAPYNTRPHRILLP